MQFDDPNVVLARELNSLSLQERNRVIESIHGVDDVVKETPQWIVKKLREFQKSLNKLLQADSEQTNITVATREAYEEAQRQSKTYVQNRAFRLMFLRAESFDASLAAQRMLVYLEEKLSRFGPEALTRPLILTDLSPQSRAMLIDLGIFQVLPTRDSVGRAIFLIHEDGSPGDMFREDPMAAVRKETMTEMLKCERPDLCHYFSLILVLRFQNRQIWFSTSFLFWLRMKKLRNGASLAYKLFQCYPNWTIWK